MSDHKYSSRPHVAALMGTTTPKATSAAQVLMHRHPGRAMGGTVPIVGEAKDVPADPGKGYAMGGMPPSGMSTPSPRAAVNTDQQIMKRGGHRHRHHHKHRSMGGQMGLEDRGIAEGRMKGETEMAHEDRPRHRKGGKMCRAMGGVGKERKGYPNT